MSIKRVKEIGRSAFKANYCPCVVAALLLVLLAGGAGGAAASSGGNAMSEADAQAIVGSMTAEQIRAVAAALISASAVACVVSIILKIFVFNPLQVGCYRFFRKNVEGHESLGVIKDGFGGYGHTLVTLFLTDLFTVLWSLLLIIPGIVKSYSYRLVPYIIKDEPNLSAMEAIRRSSALMKGNKWKAFVMDLSFIGWFLLGAITFGLVNLFWTNPYYYSAHAAFYLDLKS